ncbi:19158_t:CDS:1 [Funneliformis geosporum]|uniref:680_t:CDS:1 n=1 Tax=Funneliformis geosporum TaxID=1117311 RepID=A0A9W4SLE9_9GLOM|nr:19158_t:CDS:1 [Funneliformis geosporum]CAI2174325.1 680_t:CDS:1 [Funneliformis geosporum]
MTKKSKSSVSFCTKYTIETMRLAGQTPTLTELNQAIVSEAKYHHDWYAAASLFEDFDKIVWERLSRLSHNKQNNSDKEKVQSDDICYDLLPILSLNQIWEDTPTALQPLTPKELKLIRCVYQIMIRYAPSVKEANYYYLHLLHNHLDTPIYDDECINHCLNSLIYLISTSNIKDYLEIGLELVEIALSRGIGKDPSGILESVSKNILAYHGLKMRRDGFVTKVLPVKPVKDRSKDKNKKKREKRKIKKLGDSIKNVNNLKPNNGSSPKRNDYSLDLEDGATFHLEDTSFVIFDDNDEEVKSNINLDSDEQIAIFNEFMYFEQLEQRLEEKNESDVNLETTIINENNY